MRRECAHSELVVATTIRPIRNEADHKAALARIDEIWDPKPGTDEADEFEVLGILVEAYEREHFAMPNPTPLEAIEFRMEQAGYTRKDLERLLGSRARVAEVLNGKRGLSIEMVRALNAQWGIAVDVLLPAVRSKPRIVDRVDRRAAGSRASKPARVAGSRESRA